MNKDGNKAFFFCHLGLLLSLLAVFYLPQLADIFKVTTLPPQPRPYRFYIIAVFTVLFFFYLAWLYYYNKAKLSLFKKNPYTLFLWGSIITVFLFLCASPALLSHDLYEYSMRGRMVAIYKLNPFIFVPANVLQDMFYPLIFWKKTIECYGPVWVIIGAFHTLLFKNSVFWTSFSHKLVLLPFFLGSCFVFYKLCLKLKLKNPDNLTAAFMLNPLVIVMTLVDGHNEIAMVFFILLSVYFLLRSKYLLTFTIFSLAVNTKFVYVMLLPFYAIWIISEIKKSHSYKLIIDTLFGIISAITVTALLWLPLGVKSIAAVLNYYKTEVGAIFWFDSIPFAMFFILGKMGLAINKDILAVIFSGIFILVYLYLLYDFWSKAGSDKNRLFDTVSFLILALLFTNYSPFQPWYLLWVIPFILLSRIRPKFLLLFFLSYFLIMTFWKRMSVLAIPMWSIYFITLKVYASYKGRLRFFLSLEEQANESINQQK